MTKRTFPPCLTGILILFLCTPPASAYTRFSDKPTNCSLIGDGDVYGPGIRISLYLQWVAVIIATWTASNEARFARTVANIVTVAVFANTLNGVSASSLVVLEWWIVMFMTFFLSVGNIPFSRRLIAGSASSLGCMMVLWSTIIVANCWVWFKGLHVGESKGCDVKIYFFFHAASVYNPTWQIVFKILNAINCCLGLIAFVVGVLAIGWNISATFVEPLGDDGLGRGHRIVARGLSTVTQLLIGIVAIVEVEMTIKVNNIDLSNSPLTSSGQLVPMVIGLFTLCATCGAGIRNLLTKQI